MADPAVHRGGVAGAGSQELERFFSLSAELLCIADLQGHFLRVNDAWVATLGWSRDELDGHLFLDLVHPDDLETTLAAVAGLAEGSRVIDFVNRYRCRDGSWRWIEWRSTPDPSSGTIYAAARDVTALRQAQERERQLVALVHHSSDFVGLATLDGQLIFINQAGRRLAGLAPDDDLAGRRVFDFVAPEDLDARLDEVQRTLRQAGRWSGEHRLRNVATGAVIPVDAQLFLLRGGGGGQPELVASVMRDVTDRRTTEAALRESEAWLKASQRVAHLGHYVFDIPGDRWTSSEVLDQIFGIGPDLPRTAATWVQLVHAEDQQEMGAYLGELLASGARFDKEYRIRRLDDGVVRWVHGLGDLARDPAGRPLRLFGTIQDVTERRQVEQARAELDDRLRQAQKLEAVGQLVGGVAHDFNNLLTSIVGNASLGLMDVEPSSPLHELLTEIETTAQRAAALTRQLLAFGRKQLIEPRLLDPATLVRDLRRLLERVLGEDVVLLVDLAPAVGAVRADPGQLEQVIVNLAINARDAMPRGGRLTISVKEARLDEGEARRLGHVLPGRYAVLAVHDEGTGMSPEVRERIFEPFFTTKPKGKGTGLGLATVWGIVRQHGGAVDVDSTPGVGSSFRVHLPVVADVAGPRPDAAAGAPLPGGSERILLVEDEAAVRSSAVRILERLGYRVRPCADAAEALAAAEQPGGEFDLLVTDVVMPGMNGRALAETLAVRRPGLRTLFCSGYAQDIIVHHGALEVGIQLLPKPYTPAELARAVRAVLEAGPGARRVRE